MHMKRRSRDQGFSRNEGGGNPRCCHAKIMYAHAITCHATNSLARFGENQEDKSTATHGMSSAGVVPNLASCTPGCDEWSRRLEVASRAVLRVNPATIAAAKGELRATAAAQYANLVLRPTQDNPHVQCSEGARLLPNRVTRRQVGISVISFRMPSTCQHLLYH